jgi:hypothetical protein
MKPALIAAGCLMAGLLIALVGALSHAQRGGNDGGWSNERSGRSNEPTPSRRETPRPAKPAIPAVVPKPVDGVVVTNPGIAVAVSRFFRLWQDKELKPLDVLAEPLLLDGEKTMTATDIPGLIEKVRMGMAMPGTNNTIIGMTILPGGNTHEEAEKLLLKAGGPKGKAMLDHAEKNNAWLVEVHLARTRGGKVGYENMLLVVTNPDSEEKARVIGIRD